MADNQHDADIINADRHKQADLMLERLEKMGVSVRVAHYTGDSSYPTGYTLGHGTIYVTGPTLDLALLEFVERLLKTKNQGQKGKPKDIEVADAEERARQDWSNDE